MKAMTVYLLPHSSLRGTSPPRSDTLFGAICWGYRLLFGTETLEQRLEEFGKTSAPFLVSSLFYYSIHNGSRVHFLPRPLADIPEKPLEEFDLVEFEKRKKRRKRQFIPDVEFSALINGNIPDEPFSQKFDVFRKFFTPHSSINRLTGTVESDRFFYTEEWWPASNSKGQAGLFFCLKYRDDLENDLKTTVHFLGDKGIGGGSSVGKGHIKKIEFIDALPYDEPPAEEASYAITLSLMFPDASLRKKLSACWYDLEKRQGKIECMYADPGSGHIWKDHLLLLKEGSTFPKNDQKCYGENRIVRKDDGTLGFDVLHYGYAFTVNTKHVNNSRQD